MRWPFQRPVDPRVDHRFQPGEREAGYPEPYPTGWYRILDSRDLRAGEACAVDALGKHLVAFRGTSGEVAVVDAHCPHQGASLAAGKVDGDTLRCPFHAWAFDREGALVDIPGLERCPRVGVGAHPVVELHGMIWLFHHVSGRREAPAYAPTPLEPIERLGMTWRGRYDAGIARMHLCEFVENSVDFQHFAHVHGGLTLPWTTRTIPGFSLDNEPRWWPDEEQSHLAYFEVISNMRFRGRPVQASRTRVRVTMFGPASVAWFHFFVPNVGEIVLFETHLPRAPCELHTVFHWFAEPKVPTWLAWIIVGQWVSNWKADLVIWENKVFRERPVLVEIDGPVREMRRWFRQFVQDDGAAGRAVTG